MKILCCGDQHITNRRPKNRVDDYFDTVCNKFNQELQLAVQNDCKIVILPGDIFDSWNESHLVVQRIIHIIQQYPTLRICCIAGQHDQLYHKTDLAGTALLTLISADVVAILTHEEMYLNPSKTVALYGASWGEDIPKISNHKITNILVIHKMIIEDKLWAAQENFTWANHMMLKHKFDLVVSGDNHNQFIASANNNHLINMGAMMRSTISQVLHTPAAAVYNTDDGSINIVNLMIEPIDKIMSVSKANQEKKVNEQLEAFISSFPDKDLGSVNDNKLTFVDKLEAYGKENNIEDSIMSIVYDTINEVADEI